MTKRRNRSAGRILEQRRRGALCAFAGDCRPPLRIRRKLCQGGSSIPPSALRADTSLYTREALAGAAYHRKNTQGPHTRAARRYRRMIVTRAGQVSRSYEKKRRKVVGSMSTPTPTEAKQKKHRNPPQNGSGREDGGVSGTGVGTSPSYKTLYTLLHPQRDS